MRFAYFWVWLKLNVRDVPCGLFTFELHEESGCSCSRVVSGQSCSESLKHWLKLSVSAAISAETLSS